MKIKYILLFLMAWVIPMNSAYAQQTVTASGSVMDEKGEVLIGVSVSVKEVPSMGTITDIDGRFRIAGIKNGNTLLISYVGYDTQEIRMTKSNERMRVVLTESSNVMDEVVITASGKVQKKINVTGAITGVEAIEKIKAQTFDIVFMDMRMPVMNGLEATSLIREFNQTTPIIALTANAFDSDRENALAAGCNHFMTKPVKKRELTDLLFKYFKR